MLLTVNTASRSDYTYLKPSEALQLSLHSKALHASDKTLQDGGVSELIIVEGKSAADAVEQVRDKRFQSIYQLQGKIPNPDKHSQTRLLQHAQLGPLHELLTRTNTEAESDSGLARTQTRLVSGIDFIILLQDPDADGVHNISLLLRWFRQFLLPWIHRRRLLVYRVPLATLSSDNGTAQNIYHAHELSDKLTESNAHVNYVKGIASLSKKQCAELLDYPLHERSNPVVTEASSA